MAFKSDEQRKGFFSRLRSNVHEFNVNRHEAERKRILEKTNAAQERLKVQQGKLKDEVAIINSKNRLKALKQAEKDIKRERFSKSRTGKFIAASKKGASAVVEFERKHGKGQVRELKKIGKKVFK